MRKRHIKHIICLIIILLSYNCPAWAGHYNFKQLSLKDGLPSTVQSIYAEKKGFVWIGAKNGLGRFDGNELKRYSHLPDNPNSLPDNYIHKIVEDSLHNIWVLTDKGITRYCRKEDNFYTPQDDQGRNILVYSSCEVPGGILFGAWDRIYKFDYATRSFTLVQQFNIGKHFSVQSLYFWDEETLLCRSRWQGIALVNIRTGKTSPFPYDCGDEITSMIVDSQKRIWVAPYNNGILCFSKEGKLIATYTTQNSQLTNNVILCMTERDSQIWIGTDGGGINILEPESRKITVLERIPGNNYSLPVNSILCLCNDAYDNVWAGTIRGGMINIREVSIKTYTDVTLESDKGLSENVIISLYQSKSSDEIWIGTDGGGINQLNPRTEKFKHYPKMWGAKIVSIVELNPNELLLSLFAEGLFIFNKKDGRVRPLNISNPELNQQMRYTGQAVNLYQDTDDSILLLGKHVYRYTISTGQIKQLDEYDNIKISGALLPVSNDQETFYFNDLSTIYELKRTDYKLKKLHEYKGDTIFNSLSQDRNGTFWIGSNYGLLHYDPRNRKTELIETPLFDEVSSVVCDQQGKVWIGTDQRLFAYLINEKKIIIFGDSDGAIMNDYLPKSQLISSQGDVYMGGVKGLLRINRDLPIEASEYPELRLTNITINGESANNQLDEDPVSISVPWDNKSIAIRVMSCEKDIFRQKIYRYQIIGLNTQYIDSYNPELIIRSLPSGTYHVMAACSTKDGGWTPIKQVLTVTVLPPWYQTWWFILICILVISGSIIQAFLVTMRRKDNKLKWAMKEHEQKVYEDKVRFLINISHELRTPLTLIHAPLSRILKTLPTDEPYYLALKGIYRQSQRMKDLLNMVLNVRKMEVEETKLQIQPYPMNEWIREIAHDFINEGEARNIIIRYELDPQIDKISFDKEKCIVILNNLLINALKHNPDDSEIIIRSELNNRTGMVRVSIIDQGCGLHQVDIEKLFTRFYQGNGEQGGTGIGLSYSKMLAELHGGRIGALDNEKAGATFFFELPLRQQSEEITCKPKAYLNELIAVKVQQEEKEPVSVKEIPDANKYSLLLVDDNQDLIDFLTDTMKNQFNTIYTASNGVEALDIIRQNLPDIIVSDVMMPEMDGYELCKKIKESIDISHIPVILLTARSDEQSRQLGYKNGADSYLTKPFEIETLQELVFNRLRNREQIKERYQHTGFLPQPEDTTFSSADEIFMFKLNNILTEHLDNTELDIALICKTIGMSRATLYNKLKALTNMSANEYINKFRLEKAIILITNTDLTFIEIAEHTGFSTSRYFSTLFKQYTGETPTQYKENHKKEK